MSYIFLDLPFIKVYLDDILKYSHSDEIDYMNKLSIVLECLKSNKLKVKVKKCEFLQK